MRHLQIFDFLRKPRSRHKSVGFFWCGSGSALWRRGRAWLRHPFEQWRESLATLAQLDDADALGRAPARTVIRAVRNCRRFWVVPARPAAPLLRTVSRIECSRPALWRSHYACAASFRENHVFLRSGKALLLPLLLLPIPRGRTANRFGIIGSSPKILTTVLWKHHLQIQPDHY